MRSHLFCLCVCHLKIIFCICISICIFVFGGGNKAKKNFEVLDGILEGEKQKNCEVNRDSITPPPVFRYAQIGRFE